MNNTTDKKMDWRTKDTDTYIACCYGSDGDEPGEVEVQLQSAEDDNGKQWWTIYEPEAAEMSPDMWDTEDEARTALAEWVSNRGETPDAGDLTAQIVETGYFEDADIVPHILAAMCQYSQGYLLLTPDIRQPVGTRWTTNGYLQCEHIRVDATHSNRATAADSLLRAIEGKNEPAE